METSSLLLCSCMEVPVNQYNKFKKILSCGQSRMTLPHDTTMHNRKVSFSKSTLFDTPSVQNFTSLGAGRSYIIGHHSRAGDAALSCRTSSITPSRYQYRKDLVLLISD